MILERQSKNIMKIIVLFFTSLLTLFFFCVIIKANEILTETDHTMSIIDIAKEAGVSISTVSRFFNQPEKVSPEAARKIRAVAERTNYQPDIRRPGPKTAGREGIKTGNIAFLSLDERSPEMMLKSPALPILIGGIQRSLLTRRLALILAHVTGGELPASVDPRNCDGVILFGAPKNAELAARLKQSLQQLPAVWCFREHADPEHEFDHVFYDNRAVGVIAAEYLASRGHRHVAVFNSDAAHSAFKMRTERFLARTTELGMEVTVFCPGSAFNGNQIQIFRKQAEAFLREKKTITGAFFCADDIMLGVHNELRALSYHTAKLDSIGCNADEVLLRYLEPRPATIDIKMAEIGEMAVDHLLRRINGERGSYCSEVFIKPELIPAEEV